MDINTQLNLWKETLFLCRKCIRDLATTDIMKGFPGYGNSLLVNEYFYVLIVCIEKKFCCNRFLKKSKC